jgi:DNA-binding response OmpR family regulator
MLAMEVPAVEMTLDEPRELPIPTLSSRPLHLLSVSPLSEDHAALRRILDDSQWQVGTADSCRGASTYLHHSEAVIVFCEHSLPDGSWKRVLDEAAACPVPPLIVVTSRLADDRLWAEVLNLGGFDVLAKPFQEREVRHVIESALSQTVNPALRVRTAETA